MTTSEAILLRHSVRRYEDRPVSGQELDALRDEAAACNRESGLHIQLITGEPRAFGSRFSGVSTYFVLAGKKTADLDELCGYYGERLVLFAQKLGLNTCWAGLSSASRVKAYELGKGEVFRIAIAVGYGSDQGSAHRGKSFEGVAKTSGDIPDWFRSGVEAALLAPTAMNQQAFRFELMPDGKVRASAGLGFFSRVDLGIVKYHFEAGSGRDSSVWE